MTPPTFPRFAAVLPELILAVGALVLLMIGAFAGERSARPVNVLAVLVLAGGARRGRVPAAMTARSSAAPSSSTPSRAS